MLLAGLDSRCFLLLLLMDLDAVRVSIGSPNDFFGGTCWGQIRLIVEAFIGFGSKLGPRLPKG